MCRDGKEYIFGEAHLISDGKVEQICSDGEVIEITN